MIELFGSQSALILFSAVLAIVAFLYASVGHGGASGYLALMALFSLPIAVMRPSALLLNILVSGVSFYFYKKAGHFNWKLFYPFAITSIPASFIGGYLNVNPQIYKQVLGVLLIISILRMLGLIGSKNSGAIKSLNLYIALIAGACIGFFSGMIGIGGGIILSPLILLLNWGSVKQTAAASALFIWVNSVAGMIGLLMADNEIPQFAYMLAIIATAGGVAGGYFGSLKLETKMVKQILAVVLLIAAVKLIFV